MRPHRCQSSSQARMVSTPQVWGRLMFTEKLSPLSESLDPEPLAASRGVHSPSWHLSHSHQKHGRPSHGLDPASPQRPFPSSPRTATPSRLLCPLRAAASLGFPALRDLDVLSRPGPVFGGHPSGWAHLGSSGDWTGCGSGKSPPGAGEELSFSTGSSFSFRLWPELGARSRLVVPTRCMSGSLGVSAQTWA